jgi:hypothetical protein
MAASAPPLSALREPSDQTSIAWRDDAFLSTYPLDRRTVLDYFSGSPFYDRQCNNEVARSRGLGVESLPWVDFFVEFSFSCELMVDRSMTLDLFYFFFSPLSQPRPPPSK